MVEATVLDVLHYKSTGITLKSGQEIRVPIVVDKSPSSELCYEFRSENSNISLSVYFFGDNGSKQVLLPATYPKADNTPLEGSVPIKGCGRLVLAWDNGTTWLGRQNVLSYSIKLRYFQVNGQGERVVRDSKTAALESKRRSRTASQGIGSTDFKPQHTVPDTESEDLAAANGTVAGQPTESKAAQAHSSTGAEQKLSIDEKVTRIFRFFDQDGDDLLSYAEMDQLMRTISVPPSKLEYLQWVEVCQFWRADHQKGLPLQSLVSIYESSPGSIDEEFRRYEQLVQHGSAAIQYVPCPPGWVEVDREDGSSYYMNYADMSKTIEARPPRDGSAAGHLDDRNTETPKHSFRDKCKLVFEYFDTDGNGFIDLNEMNTYTKAVEGPSGQMLDVTSWVKVVSALQENAELGISFESFSSMYPTQSPNDRDLSRDFDFVTEQHRLARQRHTVDDAAANVAPDSTQHDTTSSAPSQVTPAPQSSAKRVTTLQQLRCADPWYKCQAIFAHFDADKDGLLNFKEMQNYTAVTEGNEGTLLRSTWETLCERKGVDPELGFACEDLFKIYHVAVDKDIAKVFPDGIEVGSGHGGVDDMNLHAKIQRIFEEFDQDQDNYMNLEEMNAFTTVTEGEQERLTREEWEHTCRRMLIDPNIGLAFNDLATIYTTHLDKDFETVVDVQRQARRQRAREKLKKKVQNQMWQEEQVHGMP